jgi:hypothetical protein
MKTQGSNFKTAAVECSFLYNRRIFDECKPRNQLKIINKPQNNFYRQESTAFSFTTISSCIKSVFSIKVPLQSMTACSTLDKKTDDVSEEAEVENLMFLRYGGIKVVDFILSIIHFPYVTQLFK